MESPIINYPKRDGRRSSGYIVFNNTSIYHKINLKMFTRNEGEVLGNARAFIKLLT